MNRPIRTDDPDFCVPDFIHERRERDRRESERTPKWLVVAVVVVIAAALAIPVFA